MDDWHWQGRREGSVEVCFLALQHSLSSPACLAYLMIPVSLSVSPPCDLHFRIFCIPLSRVTIVQGEERPLFGWHALSGLRCFESYFLLGLRWRRTDVPRRIQSLYFRRAAETLGPIIVKLFGASCFSSLFLVGILCRARAVAPCTRHRRPASVHASGLHSFFVSRLGTMSCSCVRPSSRPLPEVWIHAEMSSGIIVRLFKFFLCRCPGPTRHKIPVLPHVDHIHWHDILPSPLLAVSDSESWVAFPTTTAAASAATHLYPRLTSATNGKVCGAVYGTTALQHCS